MEGKPHKFKLEQDAGKFCEDPLKYDNLRRTAGAGPELFHFIIGMKSPVTPEREARLFKISLALVKSLERYGLKAKAYNPNLISWEPRLSLATSDPYGAFNTEERDKVYIQMSPLKLSDWDAFSRGIGSLKDELVGYTFTHELIHLYSSRSWMIEEKGGDKEEKLTRCGLGFLKNGAPLWNWLDEAVVDDLTREEYPKIENYPVPPDGYDFHIEQFNKMVEMLSRNTGKKPAEVKEIFRSAAIGEGKLLPLRSLIKPPFRSFFEFIRITDAPMRFALTPDVTKKVFNKLWQEIAAGQINTKLQTELLQNEDALLSLESLVLDVATALRKGMDLAETEKRLGQVFSQCSGAELLDQNFNELLESSRNLTQEKDSPYSKHQQEEILKYEQREIAKKLLILSERLPLIILIQRYPTVKRLFSEKKADQKINKAELEKAYIIALGIED